MANIPCDEEILDFSFKPNTTGFILEREELQKLRGINYQVDLQWAGPIKIHLGDALGESIDCFIACSDHKFLITHTFLGDGEHCAEWDSNIMGWLDIQYWLMAIEVADDSKIKVSLKPVNGLSVVSLIVN